MNINSSLCLNYLNLNFIKMESETLLQKSEEGLQTQINDYDRQIKVLQDARAEAKKQLDCTKPNWIKYSQKKNSMEEKKKLLSLQE